jgi:hypothetical protein
VCARFVEFCREMGLLAKASVAIDGSKFKAVNNRDKNFTQAKVERRRKQLEESVSQLDTADLQDPSETITLLKMRMGATQFLMKTLPKVAGEMALHVLTYNLTRVMNIVGIKPLMAAIAA